MKIEQKLELGGIFTTETIDEGYVNVNLSLDSDPCGFSILANVLEMRDLIKQMEMAVEALEYEQEKPPVYEINKAKISMTFGNKED